MTGTNAAETTVLLAEYGGSPLAYRHNGRAIASVVFLWPGMVFTVVRCVSLRWLWGGRGLLTSDYSTYLLWHSIDHIDMYGPMSTHARTRDDVAKPVTEKPIENGSLADSTVEGETLAPPGQTHAKPEGFHDRNAGANGLQPSVV